MAIASKVVWLLISYACTELCIRVVTPPLAFARFCLTLRNAVYSVGFNVWYLCSRVSYNATILGSVSASNYYSSDMCA